MLKLFVFTAIIATPITMTAEMDSGNPMARLAELSGYNTQTIKYNNNNLNNIRRLTHQTDNLQLQNYGAVSEWWYAATLTGLPNGYSIAKFEIKYGDGYIACNEDNSAGFIVYQCAPINSLSFTLPLSVKLTASNGQQIIADDKIKNFKSSATWDLGVNFGESKPKEIIGYYPSWQWYDRSKLAAPNNLDFTKLTIVNFAFFQTDTEGYLYGTDSWADPNVLYGPIDWSSTDKNSANYKCHFNGPAGEKECNNHKLEQGLISLVHAADAKIFPSIGGWTLSNTFPIVAASPQARRNFAKQCVELIKEYGFDGIDIDWEYPGYADHSGTAQDTVNFNLLLQDIRSELNAYGDITGKYYELTAALPCGPTNIKNIDVETVAGLLDQFNLMTYDFFGSWSETVGVNAPLYYQGWPADKEDFNVDGCVNNWIAGGVSKDKINIGLPFYGRSFAEAKGLNEAFSGVDKDNWPEDGTPTHYEIELKLDEMTSVRDETTKTQYAYFEEGGVVSFDNQQAICNKVEYVINQQLHGLMIWEITGDVRKDLSTPLLDEIHMKLDYPTTHNCGC